MAHFIKLFPPEEWVAIESQLVQECDNQLPLCGANNEYGMERIRLAVLRISTGDPVRLQEAIMRAKQDRRDVLIWADFGNSIHAHKAWARAILGEA